VCVKEPKGFKKEKEHTQSGPELRLTPTQPWARFSFAIVESESLISYLLFKKESKL